MDNVYKCTIQQASVREVKARNERRKPDLALNIMNVKDEEVPAKFVPAAAVTRMGQVLFIITRRKGLLGG